MGGVPRSTDSRGTEPGNAACPGRHWGTQHLKGPPLRKLPSAVQLGGPCPHLRVPPWTPRWPHPQTGHRSGFLSAQVPASLRSACAAVPLCSPQGASSMAAGIEGRGSSPEADPFFPIGPRTFQAWRWGLRQDIGEGRVPGPRDTQVGQCRWWGAPGGLTFLRRERLI